jgi:hypothetical protein
LENPNDLLRVAKGEPRWNYPCSRQWSILFQQIFHQIYQFTITDNPHLSQLPSNSCFSKSFLDIFLGTYP